MVHFCKIPPIWSFFMGFQHFSGTGTPFWDSTFAWDLAWDSPWDSLWDWDSAGTWRGIRLGILSGTGTLLGLCWDSAGTLLGLCCNSAVTLL